MSLILSDLRSTNSRRPEDGEEDGEKGFGIQRPGKPKASPSVINSSVGNTMATLADMQSVMEKLRSDYEILVQHVDDSFANLTGLQTTHVCVSISAPTRRNIFKGLVDET